MKQKMMNPAFMNWRLFKFNLRQTGRYLVHYVCINFIKQHDVHDFRISELYVMQGTMLLKKAAGISLSRVIRPSIISLLEKPVF